MSLMGQCDLPEEEELQGGHHPCIYQRPPEIMSDKIAWCIQLVGQLEGPHICDT